MFCKQTFKLLKGIENYTHFSVEELNKFGLERGQTKLFFNLKLNENNIKHYTKDYIYKTLENAVSEKRVYIAVVDLPNNVLPVLYNKSTDTILLNLKPFAISDVSLLSVKDQYACVVYGICLKKMINDEIIIGDHIYKTINGLLTSIFVKVFGKKFGLLGIYSSQITILKFLLNCYILQAYFDYGDVDKVYRTAVVGLPFDYSSYIGILNRYNFYNIDDLVSCMSETGVMRGFNKIELVSGMVKYLSINFLPALEDLSRLISTVITSDLTGTKIVPTHLRKYNNTDYSNILTIGKRIFV